MPSDFNPEVTGRVVSPPDDSLPPSPDYIVISSLTFGDEPDVSVFRQGMSVCMTDVLMCAVECRLRVYSVPLVFVRLYEFVFVSVGFILFSCSVNCSSVVDLEKEEMENSEVCRRKFPTFGVRQCIL